MNKIKVSIQNALSNMNESDKIDFINDLREFIHTFSPFKNEPVDFVKWIKNDIVIANDWD